MSSETWNDVKDVSGYAKRALNDTHIAPLDTHNASLLDKTHPKDYVNPTPASLYNLVVIGAGAGGLVSAAQAAKRGAKVALIEMELMGGDCLNIGCVPSKALLACAKRAKFASKAYAAGYGVHVDGTSVDFTKIMSRMREIRAEIASNDSVQRFKGLGVDVFIGRGSFTGPNEVTVTSRGGKAVLSFKKAVVATGGRAFVPPIKGIEDVPYVTNKTLFNLTTLPRSMAIIGGGPIGCEMAQAFARFGTKVVVLERGPQVLSREDPDAARILIDALREDGVAFESNTAISSVARDGAHTVVCFDQKNEKTGSSTSRQLKCEVLLVASGRVPNVDGVGLDKVKVEYSRHGVKVDEYLRTTNPNVYAVGDVCLRHKFTHMAGETGVMVCKNALFDGKENYMDRVIPWVTYTQPEVAHVGKYERDLEDGTYLTFTLPFHHNDRCIAEGERTGFVRIHTRRDTDEILGATIVSDEAGEMISTFTLAMHAKIGAKKVAEIIAPYPTRSEIMKYTCNQFNIRSWGGWEGLKKSHAPIAAKALES